MSCFLAFNSCRRNYNFIQQLFVFCFQFSHPSCGFLLGLYSSRNRCAEAPAFWAAHPRPWFGAPSAALVVLSYLSAQIGGFTLSSGFLVLQVELYCCYNGLSTVLEARAAHVLSLPCTCHCFRANWHVIDLG